jgi:hypothetical protein
MDAGLLKALIAAAGWLRQVTSRVKTMPLYWLCYRHNNQISVVIEPFSARGDEDGHPDK